MSSTDGGQQVSRPLQIVLGIVVGLAAIYALWAFVLSPLLSGGEEDLATPTVQGSPDVVDPDVTEDGVLVPDGDGLPESLLGDPVPETFEIFTARDPFQQLVVQADSDTSATVVAPAVPVAVATPTPTPAPAAAAGGTTGSTSGTTGSTTTPTTPGTTPGTPSGGTTGASGTSPSDGNPPSGSVTDQGATTIGEIYEVIPTSATATAVSLDQVTLLPDELLTVTIDDVAYEVLEGEVFADRFQLLDIDGRCATMLFGDSRFTLCEGESIVK